jgi:hypothetical protein
MAGDLNDVREQIAQKLADAGFRVTLDPRNVNTPCVLVGLPRSMVANGMGWCDLSFELPVSLIAPAPGNLTNLSYLLEKLPDVMKAIEASTAEPDEISVGENDLPAYTTVLKLRVNLNP